MSDFVEDLEFLTNECSTIVSRFKLFEEWFASGSERVQLMNDIAPVVFAQLQRALLADIVVGLLRLAGGSKSGRGKGSRENLVLKSLLEAADYDPSIYQKFDKEEYSTQMDVLGDNLEPLKEFRNKVVAHNDADVSRSVEATPPINLDDIRTVIENVKCVLQVPHESVQDVTFVFQPKEPLENGRHVLDLLRIGSHVKKVADESAYEAQKANSADYVRPYPPSPEWL